METIATIDVASGTRNKAAQTKGDASQCVDLRRKYQHIRQQSENLCQPLQTEDYVIQTMADVSPPKWHLAHTSWFFETLILQQLLPDYRVYNPYFAHLFNSYYESLGSRHPRPQRGLLSRPSVSEVYAYRAHVDAAMLRLLQLVDHPRYADIERLTVLGLNHEQQHQELLLTDIKHILAHNPMPSFYQQSALPQSEPVNFAYAQFDEGLYEIGHAPGQGMQDFCFDNETPSHKAYISAFKIRNYPVVNGEYAEFIAAGGYSNPEYWLSDGWKTCQQQAWSAPLYWQKQESEWYHYTLHGMHRVDPYAPVAHVSFYEAVAYARWRGARLASEQEWEIASRRADKSGVFVDNKIYHPHGDLPRQDPPPQASKSCLRHMLGNVWEWTQSAYCAYPGYRQAQGALGEYNGKFMSNQMVLRGGSCATPASHIRSSYRNFFYPGDRWQFSGFRLVQENS